MRSGEVIGKRFVIEQLAGAGGMGTVYQGRDTQSGAQVAIKVLRTVGEVETARFEREAQVLFGLHHARIVRYVSHGATMGSPFLVTEWLAGEDLAQRIARQPPSMSEVMTVGLGVAEALGAAHRLGVVHRDIKPSNIFLVGGEVTEVKLIDFGIARAGAQMLTQTGAMIGTPGYMAPEQARGERDIDARADVFSLGCVLFKCVAGRLPFLGEDMLAVLVKLVLEDAPRLRDLCPETPEALDRLVAQMLEKPPARRPAHGDAVAAALATIETPQSSRTAPSSLGRALTDTERRMMCVVLAQLSKTDPQEAKTQVLGPVRQVDDTDIDRSRIQAEVQPYGAHLDVLADGSILVTFSTAGAFTDQAARAARAALALRDCLPGATIALVAGRGEVLARLPVGEVIDRGVALLRRVNQSVVSQHVRIDDVMAGLLSASFEVRGEAEHLVVVWERGTEATRSLLGRPTPCIGRERDLSMLMALFDEVISEPVARLLRILGPPGIGKSRLRYEFLARLRQRGDVFEVWMGRGDPMRAGAPFGVLAPAIRQATAILDGEPLAVQHKKLRARIKRHVSDKDLDRVTEFLGELVGAPLAGTDSVLLRAARGDPMLMGDQMLRALEDFFVAECAAQPVVLVFEDMIWGDLPSLQFINKVLRNQPDLPLLIVVVARPEFDSQFPGIWAGRPVVDVSLGGLTRKGSEQLVRQILGQEAASELVDQIVQQAGGNAFFLEELIRAVVEGKGRALPETVLAMVQTRLDELSADKRLALRAGSIFGQVFWEDGVVALLGGGDGTVPVHRVLDELAARELIQPRTNTKFSGQKEYIFRQSLIREAAYAMLTEADRTLGHQIAGSWLEQVGESDAAVLAVHFERAEQPERAITAYCRAAKQAFNGHDLDAAMTWATRGITCFADRAPTEHSADLTALRLLQIEAYRWQGHTGMAERSATEALDVLPRGGRAWYFASAELAHASIRLGDRERIERIGQMLLEQWCDPGDEAQIDAAARVASALLMVGNYVEANHLFHKIETTNRPIEDPIVMGRLHHGLAMRELYTGIPEGYLHHLTIALNHYGMAGDVRRVWTIENQRGYAYMLLGCYEHAEQTLRQVLAAAERLGLSAILAGAKHNLGLALARLGLYDQAREVEREAYRLALQQGNRRLTASSQMYLAMILHLQEAFQESERMVIAALDDSDNSHLMRAAMLSVLANIRLTQDNPAVALQDATEALAMLNARQGTAEEGDALIRLVYAEALWANGRHGEARQAIVFAADHLRAQAERMQDPELRTSFLTRVPEHARTLALELAWKVQPGETVD